MNFLSQLRNAVSGRRSSGSARGRRSTGMGGAGGARRRGSLLSSALGWISGRNRRR
ncbi:hypothetical protein [Agrococcus sp. TF02-05]|uniref:hypothetical protein n=1 Tax=Agrococcus sp. TF02-05 TaxID=2815211 RepID=UPI001AA13A49|nr:hypothetical protein [Agrococcus sp. TF02-05]MBO1768938.1 hypothetical protein [Agrococcus sp. TF02-05]